MADSEEEIKSLLMKVEEESEKAGLKVNFQKMKIMASGPITSGQIDGKTVEIVTDFIALDSRITADADCVVLCLVAQLCPTLFDLMDCSPPGSSVPGP